MIHATNYFVQSDHKLAPFHASAFYRQVRALIDELHVFDME